MSELGWWTWLRTTRLARDFGFQAAAAADLVGYEHGWREGWELMDRALRDAKQRKMHLRKEAERLRREQEGGWLP